MERVDRLRLYQLINAQRWAAFATLDDHGAPHVSFVAYAVEPGFTAFLLYLSRLAPHTRNLIERPRASLGISEQEKTGVDPQLLGRVSLRGTVEEIPRAGPDFEAARAHYANRLPDSERLFGFSDFALYRFRVSGAHYVAGFGRAVSLDARQLEHLGG